LPRYGKPIWPLTPTVIITYESTILLGVYITLIGFLIFGRLPCFRERTYDIKISIDQFALLVRAKKDRLIQVEQIIREAGAEEVKRVDEK
ncbi:MAG: DUF3341 domain-containing protein, partial [Deltaproteobacteria bacterium]|nr:DUF3341 domain-containing protein [Deltaproteobacteria bacterium]